MTDLPHFAAFYDPDFYDLRIGPGRRVAELYTGLARERGGPVLELGSGTGQVVLAIAQAGVSVTGVEGAPRMLERSEQNLAAAEEQTRHNANFVAGMIEDFEPDRRYAQIFFGNDVIAHIHSDEPLVRALERYRNALAPGGRLVLDVSPFDYAYMGQFAQPLNHVARLRGESPWRDGARLLCWETTTIDRSSGLLVARFRYDIVGVDGTVTRTIARELCLYPRREQEIGTILRAAGFPSVRKSVQDDPAGAFLLFIAERDG
jgi:SAM-dependent methyltransferase